MSQHKKRGWTRLHLSLIAVGVAVVGIAVAVFITSQVPPTVQGPENDSGDEVESAPHHFAWGPRPWPSEGANAAIVRLGDEGPQLALGPQASISLVPVADGLSLTWTKEAEEERTQLVGTGSWRGHDVTASWTFAQGNPQAAFEISVAGVTQDELTEPFVTKLRLPAGEVRHIDDEMRYVPWVGEDVTLNAWTPLWLEWRGSQAIVAIQQGIFDQLHLAPADAGGVDLEIVWASAETRPRLAECAPEEVATVGGRFSLTFGAATPLFASRWPDGAQAVLAPLFEPPERHPDASVQEGLATSGEDAFRRVTTLARGHSNVSDPRHGNGGLLGVGLGGTVVLPDALSEEQRVALNSSLEKSRFELVNSATPTAVTDGSCEAIRGTIDHDTDVAVTGYESWTGTYLNWVGRPTAPSPGARAVVLPQLDGKRTSLTQQAFGKLYIDRLLKERGAFLFSVPLLASRNPLVPAGKQGLLEPERDGHWTIAEELTLTLADLELRVETEPLHVGSLGEFVRHWRQSRRAEIWFTEDGVTMFHRGTVPLDGFTLIASGALDPNGAFIEGREIRDASQTPQTWVWGVLPSHRASELQFGDSFAAPAPIEWVFKESVD